MPTRSGIIHSAPEAGTGDGKGGTLRTARKTISEEGLFGKQGAQQYGVHVAQNEMGPLKASVILQLALVVPTKSSECKSGDDDWMKIVERALRKRKSGKVMRIGSLKIFFDYLDEARMGGLDLVFEGELDVKSVLRDEGLNADEVDFLWRIALGPIFLGAASTSRGQHAQLHTPSARDHLNFLLVKGAGELVESTAGTVTGDLTFDQVIGRALKLKEMGQIKDFGLQ